MACLLPPGPGSLHGLDDLLPAGQVGGQEGLELGRKNTIAVNDQMQSSIEEIYAGGDIVRGGATVILAMGDGRKAALNMSEKLLNKK